MKIKTTESRIVQILLITIIPLAVISLVMLFLVSCQGEELTEPDNGQPVPLGLSASLKAEGYAQTRAAATTCLLYTSPSPRDRG